MPKDFADWYDKRWLKGTTHSVDQERDWNVDSRFSVGFLGAWFAHILVCTSMQTEQPSSAHIVKTRREFFKRLPYQSTRSTAMFIWNKPLKSTLDVVAVCHEEDRWLIRFQLYTFCFSKWNWVSLTTMMKCSTFSFRERKGKRVSITSELTTTKKAVDSFILTGIHRSDLSSRSCPFSNVFRRLVLPRRERHLFEKSSSETAESYSFLCWTLSCVIEITFSIYLFILSFDFESNEDITRLDMSIAVNRKDVTCSICGQLYTNPALIPSCGHSFDRECIARLVHCPIESCGAPVFPMALVPNPRLKGLVEGYQQSSICTYEIFLLDSSKSMWYSDSFLGLFGQSRFDMAIQFLHTAFAHR